MVVICKMCRDSGIVTAHRKEGSGVYAFRCDCLKGASSNSNKSYPLWAPIFEKEFVAEYQDKVPTDDWIISQVDQNLCDTPEFQRRLKLWGRVRFERAYKNRKVAE